MKESEKALLLLKPLLEGLARERKSTVKVWVESTLFGDEIMVVEINNGMYKVNVTGENVRSIVRSVVNAVALKF